jgi:serine/threonine protein kinase
VFQVGEKIGQGNFGKVYAATGRETGIKWAIKSINKEKVPSFPHYKTHRFRRRTP